MKLRIVLLFPALLIFLLVLALACSQGKDSPLMPDLNGEIESPDIQREPEDMFVGGLWEVAIDKNTREINILQLRSADKAMNVLGFLEPPAMFFLSINLSTLDVDPTEGHVGVHVILNHPLYSAAGRFDGFDVRGIVFGPEISNADGYTPLLRPKDFKAIPFGYIDGMLGVPDEWASFDGEYYPYKYFADGLAAEEELVDFFGDPGNLSYRGIFSEGATNVRRYEMYFDVDAGQFLVFNYAVLVSFDFPEGDPPYELDDYPLWTANCAEPFLIDASVVHNSLYYNSEDGGGGRLSIDVEVYDWQGLGNVEVTIEAPDVIAPTVATNYIPGSKTKSGVFSLEDVEGVPQAAGELELIITAADTGTTFGDSFFFDFMPESHPLHNEPAYIVTKHTLMVTDNPAPWVGPVEGDPIIDVGSVYEYHVEVQSLLYPDGPFTYEWESGDDFPPLYNDGDGGNDGSDTFTYDTPGEYTVGVRVTGPGGAQSTSVEPMIIIAIERPGSVGDLTLDVNREANYSISTGDNISLDWDAVAGAESYAVYYDPDPMDGIFTATEFAGETTETEFDFTLQLDAAAFFRVRARAIAGENRSEGPNSQGAFVDLEQAEYEGSVGSWIGNSVYDNPELQVMRSSNAAHRLSGDYGWADSIGSSSDYYNSYEVFYSDAYPEVPDSETFVFEVAHRVYNYCSISDKEDGYSMGYMLSSNPPVGQGPDNFLYYIVLNPSVGPPYWLNNDSQRDEFTYSLNPDAGYTYTYDWRFSTFNVSQLQWDTYDRIAIGHSTDTGTLNGGFFAVDDIAVIIY